MVVDDEEEMKNNEMTCVASLCSYAGAFLRRFLWMTLVLAAVFEIIAIALQVIELVQSENNNEFNENNNNLFKPTMVIPPSHPQTVFLSEEPFQTRPQRSVTDMWNDVKHKTQASDPVSILRNPKVLDGTEEHENCVPAADLQSRFYPTCNGFHEMDFIQGMDHDDTIAGGRRIHNDLEIQFLGAGKQRDAWRVAKKGRAVVMKTLKQETGFSHLSYYRQVLDAIASEQTSSSPNVIDIYGFCGTSVLNEIGTEFEDHQKLSVQEKLRYARDISAGMAALHGVGGASHAMVAHGDVRRGNLMFSLDRSVLKLSDFNQGYFLGYNSKTKKPCGYQRWPLVRKRPRDKFSSPEETYKKYLSEKTDIYHLGSVIFFLLTGTRPYAFNDKSELDDKGLPLLTDDWNLPDLPDDVEKSNDPRILTMKKAMYACYRYKMEHRATAKSIFEMLNKQIEAEELKNAKPP